LGGAGGGAADLSQRGRYAGGDSEDEHAVAVGVEAVALAEGLAVGFEDEFAGGEGADEHEEGALGEVEVGEEGVDDLELVGGVDEDVGAAAGGGEWFALTAEVFEGAGDGGADGHDAPGGIDLGGGCGLEGEVFLVHAVLAGVLDGDGAECANADVEGEEAVGLGGEEFGGEVKSGGGGGDGAVLFGEDGLVAIAVGLFLLAVNVGREGEAAVDGFIDGGIPGDEAVALGIDVGDGADASADGDGAAGLHAFAGADEAAPEEGIGVVEAEEFGAAVVGEEAGREDAGVVEDEAVAGAEVGGEVGELLVADGAGGAVHDEHAGGLPVGEGVPGDEFGGEVEVEVGSAEIGHRRRGGKRQGSVENAGGPMARLRGLGAPCNHDRDGRATVYVEWRSLARAT